MAIFEVHDPSPVEFGTVSTGKGDFPHGNVTFFTKDKWKKNGVLFTNINILGLHYENIITYLQIQ
jgi:hypothetical protein